MNACAKLQDLPPAGGYAKINYLRIPAKAFLGGWKLIGAYLGITAGAWYLYHLGFMVVEREELEKRSAQFALYPMLRAERDRAYLKQLRINRDEEAKLMKNVEGWKVGTYYGEPLYHTTPEDTLNEPSIVEYYIHAKYKDFARRHNLSLWS